MEKFLEFAKKVPMKIWIVVIVLVLGLAKFGPTVVFNGPEIRLFSKQVNTDCKFLCFGDKK